MITEKIDRITKIPDDYLTATPPPPKSVKIELSPRCNLSCGFCALRTRTNQPRTDMDFDLFKRITLEMRDIGVEEIGVFYLGESFMNPELLEDAIRYLKRELEFPYVFLTSNATLAKPDIVARVMGAGLDSLKWSVNAADPKQFKDIMLSKPILFYRALENIKRAWAVRNTCNFNTKLYASSIQFDGEQGEKMQSLIEKDIRPYVDECYFLPLYGMSMLQKDVEKRIGYKPTHGNMGRIGALRDPLPCWSAFTEGHVRYDGHLSVCCFGSDNKFDAGDLTQQTFMAAWHSDEFQAIRKAQLKTIDEGPKALTGTMCEVCVVSE